MGAVEEAGKVAGSVVESLKGAPVIIALLVIIASFLGFVMYLMGEVAQSAREDKRAQLEMIAKLVTDIRDCKQGARP